MTSRRRRSRNKFGKSKQKRSKNSRRKTRKSKHLKRRSKIRTRVSLSKRRHSKKLRPRKIRIWKSSHKKDKTPKESYNYRREIVQKPIPQIYEHKVYLKDTISNISKNYPKFIVDKGEYWYEIISGLTFRELCIDYPNTTGVFPSHPYIQTHGSIITEYSFGWAWGTAFSIQSKDCIAIYSQSYDSHISMIPPLESDETTWHKDLETPYKCVHYGKRTALIDVGNGNYYRISINGTGIFLQLGYQITHFFSDESDGRHCNVFWITSQGDLYIEYQYNYFDYKVIYAFLDKNDLRISPPIRVPELQDPVSRKQFFLKLLHMKQIQVSLLLRNLLDRTLVKHGILNEMPSPLFITQKDIEDDPLAL
jgi:hypothetical protein